MPRSVSRPPRRRRAAPSRFDLCVDAYVDGERFDPEALPAPVNLATSSHNELALAWRKQWQIGQELRIRFLDGHRMLHERVEAHARRWLEHVDLAFNFGNHADAEIRITFAGRGYSSQVGRDATRVPDPQATMQLGGFTPASDDVELRRSVLHEFGHAIGWIHEQASPAVHIPWDEPKVYAFYRQLRGWDHATTLNNVLRRYAEAETRFSEHDPASIMQYPVSNELTTGDFEIGWNTDLSEGDKSFAERMYRAQEQR